MDEAEIRATEGATWRLTAAYVSTEVLQGGVNAKGQTFGVENAHGSPDLIAVVATNGQLGYAYVSDMNAAGGPAPTPPKMLWSSSRNVSARDSPSTFTSPTARRRSASS